MWRQLVALTKRGKISMGSGFSPFFLYIFLAGWSVFFANVAHFVFLRDVWVGYQLIHSSP